MGPRLDRGDFEAVGLAGWYPRPQIFEEVAKAGYNHIAERSDTYPEGHPDRVLVTTGEMLDQNPQIVKGFLRGIIRGYRFAADEKNAEEVNKIVMSKEWEKEMGWDDFDPELKSSFGRAARFLSQDGGVRGFEIFLEEAKLDGVLPETFSEEQVARFEFQKQAAAEIDAEFGPGGYAK